MRVLCAALEFVLGQHKEGNLQVVWAKDRFSKPSAGGWSVPSLLLLLSSCKSHFLPLLALFVGLR